MSQGDIGYDTFVLFERFWASLHKTGCCLEICQGVSI